MIRFVIFSRGLLRRQWYFRIVAANGQIIAQSEGYSRRIDAQHAVTLIATQARLAEVQIDER